MVHVSRPKVRSWPRLRGLIHCGAEGPILHLENRAFSGPRFPYLYSKDNEHSLTSLSSEFMPRPSDTNSGRGAYEVSNGMGPMYKTTLCPFSSTQYVDQPWALGPHASPALWIACQGPIPSSYLCGPHCPGCSMLPASWRRHWGPHFGGWSRLSGPLFQPSCVCPLCVSANGNRSMFAVSTPAGTQLSR